MAHPARITHQEHSDAPHVLPIPLYLAVYAALMILLILTYGAAQLDLGPWNIVVALVIAVTKTILVVLFFMHVKYGTKLTWLWASVGFVWLILLFGTLGDYVTREWIRLPQGW